MPSANLELLVEPWAKLHGIACAFAAETSLDGLDEATNISIYRTVQESLSNIARHAHATQAAVTIQRLASGGDGISLTIDDNGTGFSADAMRNGFGVLGMSERVNALGGTISLSRAPTGGARIEVFLPASVAARSVV